MPDTPSSNLPAPARASLFLDFDGTLVDIAPTPDGITVPDDLADLLAMLDTALGGRLALVSGRAIASLEQHLPTFQGIIVGGHGAEMRGRDGRIERLAGADSGIADLHFWATGIEGDLAGVRAELKRTGAALHFRQAPQHEDALHAAAQTYLATHPDLALQMAHMTVELRPKDANKASAVATLMHSPPFVGHPPIFAGDDATDIPAMDHCQTAGGQAISVGGIHAAADIHLAAPQDVRRLLKDWIV
ncbi:trehalose-phosphatase [Jannaschia sp. CCS1]|uniref:trehalose-phosphatase n=1 Tax=Jannaschia sp. (strain CCS1) TaxID=290400 RepID=UPI000053BAA0|nr:trehalose-phosphatase [Jannaschia sp. CCS1]ABD54979.1 trehalose 6-phosphatase [Jannaschia sp. CCS1]